MQRPKNIFDKIGSLIPGYRGYAERDGRRNTDKILRENIVNQLESTDKILYKRIQESINNNDTDQAKNIDEVRKKINTFMSQVKYAPYGVSGFFAENQLKEDELLNIYKMDLQLAETIANITENALKKDINEITISLDDNIELLKKRNQYISEFK